MKDGLSGTTDRATGAVLPSIVDLRHSVPMATESNGSYVVNKPSARSWLTTARVRPHPTEGCNKPTFVAGHPEINHLAVVSHDRAGGLNDVRSEEDTAGLPSPLQ